LNGTDTDIKDYKIFANKLTKSKNIAKRKYFENEIQKFKGNSRKTWELIKTLLPNKKAKQLPKKLEVDGSCVHDPELIAHHFGKHFSNIATKIVKNIFPTEKNKFKDFLKNRIHDNIYLQPTDLIEVRYLRSFRF